MTRTVLLTGATGFVGRNLYQALRDSGCNVRCASRNPSLAATRYRDRSWVSLDVEQPDTLEPALEGCDAAYFLVHGMEGGEGYAEREARAAQSFGRAAAAAEVARVIYLGGVAPSGAPSPHLRSRLETGRILREQGDGVIELRAGMIIGAGSESWKICRDLAARLPFMILPRWMSSRSQPVAIEDVVAGLTHALDHPARRSAVFDLPGPETLTARDILMRIAALRGVRPATLSVPVLTPRLSSYWLKFVSGADYSIARELVEGLTQDLIARGHIYWQQMPGHRLLSFDDAATKALAGEHQLSLRSRMLERLAHELAPRV